MNRSIRKAMLVDDSKPISKVKIMLCPEARLCANILSYAEKLNNTELKNNGSCSSKRGDS